MVKLEAVMPYPIEGETTQFVAPGQTAIWKFKTTKHPDAPDRLATIVCDVDNYPYYDDSWPDPTRDFKTPTYTLNGEVFPQHGGFMFEGPGPYELEVHVPITKKAQPKGRPFNLNLNVWPKREE